MESIRHSLSHIMAGAVQELYPGTKFGIGPAIENGFYYDFDLKDPLAPEDLPKIEKKMREMIKKNLPFKKKLISKTEAKKIFKNQSYKLELIEELPGKNVTLYESGDFLDLCKGPHIKSTKEIPEDAFKLTKIAGAYWRGLERNPMLTRIYGIAFKTKKEMGSHLQKEDEAEKRDHRKINKDLDLFSINEDVGPGLILWHPKLSVVREEIELYWRKEHRKRGYQYIYSPHLGLSKLWETSGHLDFFKEGMYPPMSMAEKDKSEKTTYYVKPMNCPFHVAIYKSRPRSYRELPLRWGELGTVYRYEESGVLHGMLRLRGFTQDDAHIICREDQFVEETENVLDFAIEINKVFGFNKLNAYLSVRDTKSEIKYVGEEKSWNFAEKTLKEVLDRKKIKYQKDAGGAKFYGPAIDLKAVDALGREWQGTTIQLDFSLPQRFGMTYIGQDGKKHIPVMLHRTLLGSMERFVGVLIEQYAGAFPLWLAPEQCWVIPIGSAHKKYAKEITEKLVQEELRAELKDESETVSKKIRQGEIQKIPYLLVVGDKEEKAKSIGVRKRGKGDLGMVKLNKFLEEVKKEIEEKK